MKIKQKRFNFYNSHGDPAEPKITGLLPHEKDYEFGTPQISRRENISCVASNSSFNQCILLRLKWRPNADGQTVTIVSRLTFVLEKDVYEFSQVESYKPVRDSPIDPSLIIHYGSSASKLKLSVICPYRRTRLIFNGHMRHVSSASGPVGSDQEPRLVYIKLSCLLLPVSEVFDFYDQFDEGCLKQIYNEKKPSMLFDSVVSKLVLHDRHEQRVKLNGEYLIVDQTSQPAVRRQGALEVRGYYGRHFFTSNEAMQIKTVRLYAFMCNGQGFQIGTRRLDNNEIDFGFTTFHVHPWAKFIDKPFKIDGKLDANLRKFNLEVSGQQCTFEYTGERHFGQWFKLKMNNKPGWGWLSLDDDLVDSEEETLAMERCRNEQELSLKSGKISRPHELDPCQRPLVVSIEDDCCSSSDLVGAKAASLAQLHKFVVTNNKTDYRVPHALVLTRFAHDFILEASPNLRDAINDLKQFVAKGDLSNLRDECKKVQEIVSVASLPKSIADEFWEKLTTTHKVDNVLTFAVRSSSWGEDEADMSAAGQLSTILNVKFNLHDLSAAVMSCFAHKFSGENVEYKRQHGQPLDLPMAVVIQQMIPCEEAGVMFTCDPTSGDESVLTIAANYGLGESVVSGQADPDSIKVRVSLQPGDYSLETMSSSCDSAQRSFKIEEVTVGKKETVIEGHSGEQSNHYDKSKCCLSDQKILQLAKCGIEVKQYFWSQRRDIEWGFKDGQLYLFQSRPVTGLESFTQEELLHEFDRCLPGELCYYTRANIGEVMPSAIKPLTLTFSVANWSVVAFKMFNKIVPDDYHYAPHLTIDFLYQKYHALFNCGNSGLLSLDRDKKSVLAKSMEIGYFGREVGFRSDIAEVSKDFLSVPQPFDSTRFKFYTWQLKLMPVKTVERELPLVLKLREDVRNLKLASGYESNKLLGLYNQLCAIHRYGETLWENHILVIMFSTNSNVALSAVLSKYIHDSKQLCAATNRFLAISPDVVSAEIPERVRKMAELVKAKGPQEAHRFAAMSADEALKYLLSEDEANKALKAAFDEFMVKFGHRCYNEFELADLAWRENPTQVVEMIQRNCSALANEKDSKQLPRDKTIDDVIKTLNIELTFMDKILIKHVLAPKSQLMLSLREKTKNTLVMFNDIIRESSRMLAAELVRNQRIPDEKLFYYLAFDEVEPVVMDYRPAIVTQAVKRRQLFKRMFSELWKFEEIFTEVIPIHMKPKKELDEAIAQAPKIVGTPASSGKVQGKICRVEGYKDLDRVRPGTILLTHSTDIAFSPVFPMISGIITEVGGLISHGAVVAREYGLPSIIGIPDVMEILQDGEEIILDADNGTITRLSKTSDGKNV